MSDEKIFTVKLLRETLDTMPDDWEVWIRLEGYADALTHIKLGRIGGNGPHLILQSFE